MAVLLRQIEKEAAVIGMAHTMKEALRATETQVLTAINKSVMITDNGKPVALHGHRTACGCNLLAFGTHATTA
ncbi:PAAR domain-containing protein [Glaciimonas soli]|uniref:PAAR motif-containing protein n=1 Tax=Glaciimonas soli TaxID=2590999 RepID=A0A843YVE2_9BURK|nr:PAAR domain-containing protein [Glaciimonas soli]MQR01271.1 hypothetical protein [Glaciimonas soli]